MATNVKPITTFSKTIDRAVGLIDFFETEPGLEEKDDLLRAAVVLAVAGFDRYFTSKFCDVLVPHLKNDEMVSNGILKRLEDAGLNAEFTLELLVSERPFRKIRTLVQNSLSKQTTHRMEVIDDLFLSFSLKNLSENAQRKARRSNLLKRIDKLVDIRNDIAHEAHNDTRGNPKKIDATDIRNRIRDVKLFVESCDEIINNRVGIRPAISA